MKERARDLATTRACGSRRRAVDIANKGERVVAARRDDGRVVELVAAQDRARGSKRAIRHDAGLAIAKRHAALFKTGFDAKQASHRMRSARGVDKGLA